MKKVTVLMSTYNGEKYVEEQLLSILNQSYKNINIFVRDDGSTDGTLDILKKYEERCQIQLEYGENIGFVKSFYRLLDNAQESDYYSFADQDDVWLDDKIEAAVTALDTMESNEPALYFCDFDLYDMNMNFISHKEPIRRELTFVNALVNMVCSGFTCVMNNELKKKYLEMPPHNLFLHDYLTLLCAVAFGNVFYDSRVYAKYRRHGKNTTVTGENFIKVQIWRFKNFIINDKVNYKKLWRDFYDVYCDSLTPSDKKLLLYFIDEKYSVKNAAVRFFYPKRYRETIFDELAVRFMFAIGRL